MRWLRRAFMQPPDCRRVMAVLQAYLDGELPASQTHVVAEHLRHCERCGVDERIYRQVKRSLEALAVPADREVLRRLRSYADDLASDDAV